ncbi:MAG TPA: guanitoxin biosynthesis heme-dependent pre-guanitoxin N-hydroxylase GntA [Chitinophagaceae bacterium]|nr:guanitoxin biosynthesis heme-dependent pre-guanitoxin N-hydroxylase GntA [Chitinophagaceae bacterium]
MTATAENIKIDTVTVINEYLSFLDTKEFPCIAAKAALAKQNVKCMVAGNMACPKDDADILQFIYDFVDEYRRSKDFYHTAAIIFTGPQIYNEEMFDTFLWQRLQALEILDAKTYTYDSRVEADPSSAKFSFSIKEEAFYIIGLHTASSRQARQFKYPTLVFNPHAQFEQLKETAKYDMMKNAVRKRDIVFSGSVNPMLQDFGESSEAFQYSGRKYDESWQCPLKITHAETKHNSSP